MQIELEDGVPPIELLVQAFRGIECETLHFSYYRYDRRTAEETRTHITVERSSSLDRTALVRLMAGLDEGFELAFHSNILCSDKVFHVPLIDFCFEDVTQSVLSRFEECFCHHHYLKEAFCHYLFANAYLFHSGRSFHGYIVERLDELQWREFMGALLLFNTPKTHLELPDIVDARWVGHRLIYGDSALRLSCETGSYLKLPSFDSSATRELRQLIASLNH